MVESEGPQRNKMSLSETGDVHSGSESQTDEEGWISVKPQDGTGRPDDPVSFTSSVAVASASDAKSGDRMADAFEASVTADLAPQLDLADRKTQSGSTYAKHPVSHSSDLNLLFLRHEYTEQHAAFDALQKTIQSLTYENNKLRALADRQKSHITVLETRLKGASSKVWELRGAIEAT